MFYLSSENTVKEIAYDKAEGWFEGSIGKKRYIAAPYSRLAVCNLMKGSDMEMRVYCQLTDNTIQEFGIKGKILTQYPRYNSYILKQMRARVGRRCQISDLPCQAPKSPAPRLSLRT